MRRGNLAAGLTVARHCPPGAGLRYFGPYLGGLRARQAAAATGRVCPLAATAAGVVAAAVRPAAAAALAATPASWAGFAQRGAELRGSRVTEALSSR